MTEIATMKPRPRGDKRGSLATFRRRLTLLWRLRQGPAVVQELIDAANAEQPGAYPSAAALAVKHDLQTLRSEFECVIRYVRPRQVYELVSMGTLAPRDAKEMPLEYDRREPQSQQENGFSHAVRDMPPRVVPIAPDTARTTTSGRPEQPISYQVVYELAPAVACSRDVAHWFANTAVQYRDDYSALVVGQTTDLMQACQILVRYGPNCRVLDPPELVSLMRETVIALAALYDIAVCA